MATGMGRQARYQMPSGARRRVTAKSPAASTGGKRAKRKGR